jgi:hypothetical protein
VRMLKGLRVNAAPRGRVRSAWRRDESLRSATRGFGVEYGVVGWKRGLLTTSHSKGPTSVRLPLSSPHPTSPQTSTNNYPAATPPPYDPSTLRRNRLRSRRPHSRHLALPERKIDIHRVGPKE